MRQKWLMFAIAYVSALSFLFAMQSLPPVIPQIINEFGVSHAEAGVLTLLVALPAIFLSLPAGILTIRWGVRKAGGLGLGLCTIGLLTTCLSSSFVWLGIGRFIIGVGGAFVTVSSISILPQWFTREELGKAMGFYSINMPIASVVALNLLPGVAGSFGWRASFLIATALSFIITIIYLSAAREKPREREMSVKLSALKNRQMWILGAVWALFNMAALSYVTWGGTFFIELKNIPPGIAFFLASFLMLASIFVSPIAGHLSDRFGRRKIFLTVAPLVMFVSFLLIPGLSLPLLILPVVLLSVSSALLPPPLFSLPPEIIPGENTGLAYGIMNSFLNAGIAFGPALVGYVRDTFAGEFPIYFVMAAFSILAFTFASLLKTR